MTNLTYEQARKAVEIHEINLLKSDKIYTWEDAVQQITEPEWREQAKQEALKTREEIKWIAMNRFNGWSGYDAMPNKTTRGDWEPTSVFFDLCCLNMPEVPAEQWQDTLIKVRD